MSLTLDRRTLMHAAWLGAASPLWARAPERASASSVILLWMAGGPSQLETFDPHAGEAIAAGTRAIKTSVPGIEIAAGLPRTAELMHEIALVRSVVSLEGDHERATYNMKTGWRPDPTLVHPSVGAVLCHEQSDAGVEIPRHVTILPGPWPSRGGYLGAAFDAFKVHEPERRVPDLAPPVEAGRQQQRLDALAVVERAFARGRRPDVDASTTRHNASVREALTMMSSKQVEAFDIGMAPARERAEYGDTPFGRGCLAAVRLVEAGVRCVEVTLAGWDSHANNHEVHARLTGVLDPAFAALVKGLKERGLLERTVVICGGEFGRTPAINPLDGRDHWPHAYSVAIAGGGFRGGVAHGSTDPTGKTQEPTDPVRIADVHATVLRALGIDADKELDTPVGRPMALSDGRVRRELLKS